MISDCEGHVLSKITSTLAEVRSITKNRGRIFQFTMLLYCPWQFSAHSLTNVDSNRSKLTSLVDRPANYVRK